MLYKASLIEIKVPQGTICNSSVVLDTVDLVGDGRRSRDSWLEEAGLYFFKFKKWEEKSNYKIILNKVYD